MKAVFAFMAFLSIVFIGRSPLVAFIDISNMKRCHYYSPNVSAQISTSEKALKNEDIISSFSIGVNWINYLTKHKDQQNADC
mmetsp:Transcript_62494/g.71696  ORF Transcript_62494/g.71696 Transcript_62494/m.71696 type:complete len:82 (+) Transcript_62494:81-326(+)